MTTPSANLRVGAVATATDTADGEVSGASGYLYGCVITSDGSNVGTAQYRDTNGSGTILLTVTVPATAGSCTVCMLPKPIPFGTALYLNVTTPGVVTTLYT